MYMRYTKLKNIMPRPNQFKSPLGPRRQTAVRLGPDQLADFELARAEHELSKREVIEKGLTEITALPESPPYGTQRKIVNLMLPPEVLIDMKALAEKHDGGLAEVVHACALVIVKK